MGKRNRQRNREFRKAERARSDGPRIGLDRVLAMFETLTAGTGGVGLRRFQSMIGEAFDGLVPKDRVLVNEKLNALVDHGLGVAFDHGWLPNDLAHLVRIKIDERHEDELAAAMNSWVVRHIRRFDEAPEVWADAYDEVRARQGDRKGVSAMNRRSTEPSPDGWQMLLALIGSLQSITALPVLCAGPKEWSSPLTNRSPPARSAVTPEQIAAKARKRGLDPKLLERVRALLAKAEGTSFTEEAEAFTAKAQLMMTKHGFEAALFEATSGFDLPVQRRLWIENPYADAKGLLLEKIAGANRAKTIFHPHVGCHSIVGFGVDLDVVEVLFTSLLVQGASFVMAQGSQVDRTGKSTTASFRRSFWVSYATRIGQRLHAIVAGALVKDDAERDGALLPVLASREKRVGDSFARAFPSVTEKSFSVTNRAGWVAGKIAADQAEVSAGRVRLGHA